MSLRIILLIVCFAPAWTSWAQVGDFGLRVASFGGAGSALKEPLGHMLNPAAIGMVRSGSAGVFVTQGFGLPDLRYASSGLSAPLLGGGIGLDAATFGNDAYRSIQGGVTLASRVLPSHGVYLLGARISYRSVGINGFDQAGLAVLDVGWIADVHAGLSIGGTVSNLLESRFNDTDRVPRSMRIGLATVPVPGILVVADLAKEDRWPISAQVGFEITIVSALALRAGSATNPERLSAGARLTLGSLQVDVLADRHIDLGWTPGLGVTVAW